MVFVLHHSGFLNGLYKNFTFLHEALVHSFFGVGVVKYMCWPKTVEQPVILSAKLAYSGTAKNCNSMHAMYGEPQVSPGNKETILL